MKIDGNLRQAIRSAHKAQPDTNWTAVMASKTKALNAFVNSAKGKKAKQILGRLTKLYAETNDLSKTLCQEFGLRHGSGGAPELATCDSGATRYIAAGGTLPKEEKKWNLDAKMLEIASANEKDAEIILRGIGINWK